MAISFVGWCSGTTSGNLQSLSAGTLQAGDLVIGFSFRDGNNTAPTVPSSGVTGGAWTQFGAAAGTNSNGSSIAWKIATNGSDTTGTWTSATTVIFHVYRGTHQTTPVGGNGDTEGSGTSVTYPTVSMTDTGNTSWVAGFAGHRSTNTSLETAPSGMTARSTDADGTDEAAGHDTNGTVSSWSGTAVSVGGTSSGWRARTVEIRAPASGSVGSASGSGTASGTGTSLAASPASASGVG